MSEKQGYENLNVRGGLGSARTAEPQGKKLSNENITVT
jgi:hypothetical protein